MMRISWFFGFLVAVLFGAACQTPVPEAASARWWKGNLHTHSLWSDGDDFPEMVTAWYKDQGYDFLALSDHNTLAEGERWVRVPHPVEAAYTARFGDDWVARRVEEGDTLVRLQTLAAYRGLFEEPGVFLLIQSEEITDGFGQKPVHVNATNIQEAIPPQGGESVREVMQRNVDAVLAQRARTGRPMFPHINHPNFGWAVTAEDLIALQGERFFEVYNGHPLVHNEGDSLRPGTERLWDIILAERLARGEDVLFGIATDDAHAYHEMTPDRANPGRGWVMVRADSLSPGALIAAMEAGDFYASTGVTLADVRLTEGVLALEIAPEAGVTYVTRFIGTRRDYDASSEPIAGAGESVLSRRYSDDIGVVLAEVAGTTPTYTLAGDERYVRAVVVSSRPKDNPYRAGEVEKAWTQPVVP